MEDLKHISRVKTGKTNGWQVRLMREGKKHSKFFSLKRFGNEAEALQNAQTYRNSLLALAPPTQQNKVDMSPDAGIRIEVAGNYRAWVASWVDGNGKRRQRRFSIRKYGNLKAKQMARKARMLGVARLDQIEVKEEKSLPTLQELVSQ